MKASEIMSHPVVTVTPDTSVRAASAILTEQRIGSLPVLDEGGRIVGIISEVDLLRGRLPHDPRQWLARPGDADVDPPMSVGNLMTTTVVCLPGFTDTADVAEAMVENNLRAIPITDGPTLVGIVSRRDLLGTLLRDDAVILKDVRLRLDDFAAGQDRWKVEVEDGVVCIHGPFDDDEQQRVVTTLARTVPGAVRVHIRPRWFG